MSTRQRRTRYRTVVIPSPRAAAVPQPASMLAVMQGQSSIDLAELARAIAADPNLCHRVLEAAIEEFGWPGLNVEQAIVLLGRERLATLFLHLPNPNRMARARHLCPPGPLQGKPE